MNLRLWCVGGVFIRRLAAGHVGGRRCNGGWGVQSDTRSIDTARRKCKTTSSVRWSLKGTGKSPCENIALV